MTRISNRARRAIHDSDSQTEVLAREYGVDRRTIAHIRQKPVANEHERYFALRHKPTGHLFPQMSRSTCRITYFDITLSHEWPPRLWTTPRNARILLRVYCKQTGHNPEDFEVCEVFIRTREHLKAELAREYSLGYHNGLLNGR